MTQNMKGEINPYEAPREFQNNEAPSPLLGTQHSQVFWAVWAVAAAFGTYFCMYAFRKPFTAASFAELSFFGLPFKTLLVTSQVAGYMVSKFIGIKVIAEICLRTGVPAEFSFWSRQPSWRCFCLQSCPNRGTHRASS